LLADVARFADDNLKIFVRFPNAHVGKHLLGCV
jgi:hypothetical protein